MTELVCGVRPAAFLEPLSGCSLPDGLYTIPFPVRKGNRQKRCTPLDDALKPAGDDPDTLNGVVIALVACLLLVRAR